MKKLLKLLFVFVVLTSFGSTLHVSPTGSHTPPFADWATAATNIQEVVDAASDGDTMLVNDGHYLLSSEIFVTNNITIQSVNGPDTAIIDGDGITRCFNLGSNDCVVSGFTITNGHVIGGWPDGNGGGIYCESLDPTVSNCVISGNATIGSDGGGMYGGTAYNCAISGNSASYGGGMGGGSAYSCTISGNSADEQGGGVAWGDLFNCVVWYNTDIDGAGNLEYTTASHSCSPDVEHGLDGNITNAPLLLSSSHIAINSPCRGAGSAAYASGTDIDGEAWLNLPSMGCDENDGTAATTGAILLILNIPKQVIVGREVACLSSVIGKVSSFHVDFGSGHVVSNAFVATNAWDSIGEHDVVLTAYNDDFPGGYSVTQSVDVISLQDVAIYVAQNGGSDANDGQSWATAKATIQAGVDAQLFDGGAVYVANGTYRLSYGVWVGKDIIIQSVNGPDNTILHGGGSNSCFNLGNSDCLVAGFTIANGYSSYAGGGVYCYDQTPVVSNCVFSGNRATSYGGAMYYGTAKNCVFSGNSASSRGGGMYYGTANNCTFTCNSASDDGGGMYYGTANNCIIWFNTAGYNGNDLYSTTANGTCSPDVMHGSNGCITNAPLLLSSSHIATNSPCRGAGSIAYASGVDIDGEAWLSPPSMGCDEINGSVTTSGPLSLTLILPPKVIVSGDVNCFVSVIGKAASFQVDFGNGHMVSNSFSIVNAWDSVGTYDVVLTAYNGDYPDGLSITQSMDVLTLQELPIHVSPDGNDAYDGQSWATAKATIQAGVDAQFESGLVLVSNGTYNLSSEITVNKDVVIRSANGAATTIADGGGRVRCFNLGTNACTVEGFTIANGYSEYANGIGVYCDDNTPQVNNCVLTGNSTSYGGGGGMYEGTANNCVFFGNSASSGGGMSGGTANNCVFSGNSGYAGGGMFNSKVNNCTFTGNSSVGRGGGMFYGTANNCIVWYNKSGQFNDDVGQTACTNSCSPDFIHGNDGNITNAPLLISSSHIDINSPCRGAGCAEFSSGTDIEGDDWQNPPSIGCDEPTGLAPNGPIRLELKVPSRIAEGWEEHCHWSVLGQVTSFRVDFGDGDAVLNHFGWFGKSWAIPGIYDVVLTAYSASYPGGTSVTQSVEVVSASESTIYVAPDGNDSNDGWSWVAAKATIQAGVDAQQVPGGLVAVSNGTYSLSAPVSVEKKLRILGIGGPEDTFVDGGGSVCCFDLGSSICVVEGFTIRNGRASPAYPFSNDGGGIYCANKYPQVNDCIFTNNAAADDGGGMYYGTANHCRFIANSANKGGGLYGGTANNCTFSSNSVEEVGGGMMSGIANYCTFDGNSAESMGGGLGGGTANYCTFNSNFTHRGYGGGGMSRGTANHCTFTGNSTGDEGEGGGGVYYGTANYCTFSRNSTAISGGGMLSGTANNCIFVDNSASYGGGGMKWGTANNCIFSGNSAVGGGGMLSGTANNCTFTRNRASSGSGGAMNTGEANYCTFIENSAEDRGGGMAYGTVNNCTFTGNLALAGGGMAECMANNCTLTGNSATNYGGGIWSGTANNCIVWYNTAGIGGNDLYILTANHTCSPDVMHGTDGNITNEPLFVDQDSGDYRLLPESPCIDAGDNAFVSWDTDLAGNPRIMWDTVDMGAFEHIPEPMLAVSTPEITVSTTFGLSLPANSFELWYTGEGTLYFSLSSDVSWLTLSPNEGRNTGEHDVISISYDIADLSIGSHTGQITITSSEAVNSPQYVTVIAIIRAPVVIHYVDPNNPVPVAPYTSWNTAANNIQDAVDASGNGDLILVNDGHYLLTSEIAVTKNISIQSVNGPNVTILDGRTYGRCFDLGSDCFVSGFTISNGYGYDGGGVYCWYGNPVLSNCTFVANRAGHNGGGMYGGTAYNCVFNTNTCSRDGGGMYFGEAHNCTFNGNSVTGWPYSEGGGMHGGKAFNCEFYNNTAIEFNGEGGGMYIGEAYNCLFSGNRADVGGGGLSHSSAYGCMLTGNSAEDGHGGGSLASTLDNCILMGNTAYFGGGGCSGGTLLNCTLTANSANIGGGSYDSILNNCIVYFNTATAEGDNWYEEYFYDNTPKMSYCCTTPLPVFHIGPGNISVDPRFINKANGDFHLSSESPCINVGNNVYVSETTDLAGNPRIINGFVDMGAYEYDPNYNTDADDDGMLDSWEIIYFGHSSNGVASADSDGDGQSNLEEYISGMDPTNAASRFAMGRVSKIPEGFVVTWNARAGRIYDVLWTPSLNRGFQLLETELEHPTSSYTDTVHSAESTGYYMVRVRLPNGDDSDGDGLPDAWESDYFSDSVSAVAAYDFDGDGQNNIEEYIAGTNPTNAASLFKVTQVVHDPVGIIVQWASVTGRVYSVLWSSAPSGSYKVLQSGIDYPQNSYTDDVHGVEAEGFYKLDVRLEP